MGQSSRTDEELVAFVAYSNEDALSELYDRYVRQVFSMAAGILRDRAMAEDVTQEVFVSLWTRAATFDPARGRFRQWFLHLAHNRVIDELRRRKRVMQHSADQSADGAEQLLASPVNTADEAITAVLFGEAVKALAQIPPEQRTAVAMAYLEGNTQQEIAARTGVPLGTVKTRLRLGMIKLRHLLVQQTTEGE